MAASRKTKRPMSRAEVYEAVEAGRYTLKHSPRPVRWRAWEIAVVTTPRHASRKQGTIARIVSRLRVNDPEFWTYLDTVSTRLQKAMQPFRYREDREVWVDLKPASFDGWVVEVLSLPDWYSRNQQNANRYLKTMLVRIQKALRLPPPKGLSVSIDKLE